MLIQNPSYQNLKRTIYISAPGLETPHKRNWNCLFTNSALVASGEIYGVGMAEILKWLIVTFSESSGRIGKKKPTQRQNHSAKKIHYLFPNHCQFNYKKNKKWKKISLLTFYLSVPGLIMHKRGKHLIISKSPLKYAYHLQTMGQKGHHRDLDLNDVYWRPLCSSHRTQLNF